MALSGSFNTNDYDGRYYTLSWSATQSIANNQSTITWKISCAGGSGWYAERTLYAVLAGVTLINKTERVQRRAEDIASGSFVVTHASDGTFGFTGEIQVAVYTSSVNCTGSAFWALNQIPRQANLTGATNFHDESPNPTITYSNPAGGAVMSLQACISLTGAQDDITYRDVDKYSGSYTFSLTEEEVNILRNATPNSTSRNVIFYLKTVIGGNTFYSALTRTFELSNDVVPTAEVSVIDTAGWLYDYGKYVQGQSKLKITISAEGVYGSTIKSYKTTIDGKTYTSSDVQTDVIAGKGVLDLEVVVTDSRGRVATVKQSLDIYEYKRPRILSLKSKRCQQHSTGVAGDKHLGVLFESEVTTLDSQNTAKYEIAYKKITEDSYTVMTLDEYSNQYSVQGNAIFPADKDAYNIILRITDDFVTVEKKITGPSISVLMSKLRYNLGLAFGKLAELEGVFDIGFKTRFSGGILQDALDDGKELNELVTPNTYLVESARVYPHAPESDVNAVLTISGNESFLKQRFEVVSGTQPRVYERIWGANGYGEIEWNAWKCLDDSTPLEIPMAFSIDSLGEYSGRAYKIGRTVYVNGIIEPRITGSGLLLVALDAEETLDVDITSVDKCDFPLAGFRSHAEGYINAGSTQLAFNVDSGMTTAMRFNFAYVCSGEKKGDV